MAISILNTTTGSHAASAPTGVAIPATTQGSTLIVSITSVGGTGNFPDHVVDDGQFFPSYTKVIDGARTDSGLKRTAQTHYRDNVQGGITNVYVVANNTSGMTMWFTIYEVSGINHTTPFEVNNLASGINPSSSSTSGTPLATAYTNALYISPIIRSSAASVSSGGGYSADYTAISGTTANLHQHKIASGTNTSIVNHAIGSAAYLIGAATFNPSPNSYVLNLNDDIAVTDDLADATDYSRSLSDSVLLTDDIDLINFSNNQFKSLSDMLSMTDTVDTILSAERGFSDAVFLGDNISFQYNSARTFVDTIQLTEWMSIKKINSTGWGN